jgi:hypothetical protein
MVQANARLRVERLVDPLGGGLCAKLEERVWQLPLTVLPGAPAAPVRSAVCSTVHMVRGRLCVAAAADAVCGTCCWLHCRVRMLLQE